MDEESESRSRHSVSRSTRVFWEVCGEAMPCHSQSSRILVRISCLAALAAASRFCLRVVSAVEAAPRWLSNRLRRREEGGSSVGVSAAVMGKVEDKEGSPSAEVFCMRVGIGRVIIRVRTESGGYREVYKSPYISEMIF